MTRPVLAQAESADQSSSIKIEITKDQDLLNQYYELRHYAFNKENGFKFYDGSKNEFDDKGRIIVATRDSTVIGGARLMFSDECEFLSNEIKGTKFNYADIIKKYKSDMQENLVIGEMSAFFIAKNERNYFSPLQIGIACVHEFIKHGCSYFFAIAETGVLCRTYRVALGSFGHHLEVFSDYIWKKRIISNFTDMVPICVKIS